jgi:predicted cupin superfamily sugar epimerase
MQDIQSIINKLQLLPHVEGGYYRETYRSEQLHQTSGGPLRSLSTLIYFLLPSGRYSKFHKIASDELWLYHLGAPVAIHQLLNDGTLQTDILGSDIEEGQQLQVLIPAGTLFGAEVLGVDTFALSACMVSPGFDFADFNLYNKEVLLEMFPQQAEVIERLHQ